MRPAESAYYPSRKLRTQRSSRSGSLISCTTTPSPHLLNARAALHWPSRRSVVRSALLDKVQRKTSATDPFHGSKKKMAPEWDAEERHGTSKLVCQLFLSQLIKYVPASVAVVGLAAPPPGGFVTVRSSLVTPAVVP